MIFVYLIIYIIVSINNRMTIDLTYQHANVVKLFHLLNDKLSCDVLSTKLQDH